MKPSSLRRIANFRTLIAALAERSMGPHAVAALLAVSHTAARNYLHELIEAGVVRADATQQLEKSAVRLSGDQQGATRFLAALTSSASEQRLSVRASAQRHNERHGQCDLHVLADDVNFPLTLQGMPARRDPLVAALFGAASGAR